MEHVQAKWYHEGRTAKVRVIVIHCTVSPNSLSGAEGVAAYFAKGDRRASAHEVADQNSVVECVYDKDTAFAAAGANSDGWHIELCGYPDWTRAEWLNRENRKMLVLAAARCREKAEKFGIPIVRLTSAQLKAGKAGFVDHNTVSQTYPGTGHWDPGPNFPWDAFLILVQGDGLTMADINTILDKLNAIDERLQDVEKLALWTFWHMDGNNARLTEAKKKVPSIRSLIQAD